ncbi:MAG: PAS domain S-box protein [Phycisphaerae bacterium]
MRFLYQGRHHAVIAVRDITERVEAENRLRLSEERLRAILTSTPDVLFVLDCTGRYVDVFTSESQLLALPADELLGRTIHEVLPPGVAGPAQEVVDDVLATGQPRKHEYAIDLHTGERRWFTASVARFAHMGADRVVWAARDITDRVLAEQAAREAEARFQEVLDHSQAILFRFNMKTRRCEYLSQSAGATTGQTVQELQSWSVEEHLATFHPDDRERLKAGMDDKPDQFPGQKNVVAEFRRMGPDGEYRWFADWSTYFYDEEGTLEAIVGSAYDITERKIAERELRQARDELEQRVVERTAELAASKERWRSIVETAPNVIWFIDREGTIRYINRRPSGKPVENAIGSHISEHFATRHRRTVCEALERTIRHEQISECEVEGVLDGRSAGWFSMRLGPVRRGEKVIGATLVAVDVTTRRQAEAALHSAQQQLITAQETERRRLAADLHDSVSQMLFALQMKLKRLHSSCQECRQRDQLNTAVEQVNQLIQETRAIYRGLYPPGLVQMGLAAALRQLVRSFEGPVTVNLVFDSDARSTRFGDEVEIALFRVAQEAIRNAVTHSGTETIDVSLECTDRELVLEIGDYGGGFDPSAASGTSLGLGTMRERAESIGGRLKIDSDADGTSVRVTVPLDVCKG